MMKQINVIKVGGAIVENEASLSDLIEQFSRLDGPKVLVHGGGRSATKIAASLGIESQMVGGRRITDEEMLRVVTMVYGGLVNKNLVARLQAKGVNAIGLTGADMNVIRSKKRPPIPLKGESDTISPDGKHIFKGEDGRLMVDFGWVGDVEKADGERLLSLIEQGLTPVMAPLTHDGEGHMLNTNADTIASTVAVALANTAPPRGAVLTYCFEKPGVLRDPDDDNSVIRHITPSIYEQLKAEGTVSGGMIPKLDNAFDALRRGVSRVIITSAADIKGEHGTVITLD